MDCVPTKLIGVHCSKASGGVLCIYKSRDGIAERDRVSWVSRLRHRWTAIIDQRGEKAAADDT